MPDTPNGTKRTIGFALMVLPLVLPFFGYTLADSAPVEIARLADPIAGVIGGVVLIYGTIKAKGKMWFIKQ